MPPFDAVMAIFAFVFAGVHLFLWNAARTESRKGGLHARSLILHRLARIRGARRFQRWFVGVAVCMCAIGALLQYSGVDLLHLPFPGILFMSFGLVMGLLSPLMFYVAAWLNYVNCPVCVTRFQPKLAILPLSQPCSGCGLCVDGRNLDAVHWTSE